MVAAAEGRSVAPTVVWASTPQSYTGQTDLSDKMLQKQILDKLVL
jgi:hypothetical protein